MSAPGGAPAYRRIVLKLSGEALAGRQGYGIDPEILARVADEVGEVVLLGVQVAVVIGGGDIFFCVPARPGGLGGAPPRDQGQLPPPSNAPPPPAPSPQTAG